MYIGRDGTISVGGGKKEDSSHSESWRKFGEWLPHCSCTVVAGEIMSHCHSSLIIPSIGLSSVEKTGNHLLRRQKKGPTELWQKIDTKRIWKNSNVDRNLYDSLFKKILRCQQSCLVIQSQIHAHAEKDQKFKNVGTRLSYVPLASSGRGWAA